MPIGDAAGNRQWAGAAGTPDPAWSVRLTPDDSGVEAPGFPTDVGTPADHEAAIREEVDRSPERHIAEAASSVLAVVLDRSGEVLAESQSRAAEDVGPSPERLILPAVLAAAARAFRTARAGMAVVRAGYELEADAMTRVMLELYVSARAILDDPTGVEARAWVTGGRRRGIGKRVDAAAPGEIYDSLSAAAHGDPRGLRRLAVERDDGPTVEWGPRLTERFRAVLIGFALGARDMTVLLEEATGQTHPELSDLDDLLVRSVPGWSPGRDWSTS